MKSIILIINFALLACFSNAQNARLDSLNKALAQAKSDTARFSTLAWIIVFYTYSKPDSAMMYAQEEISLARKIKTDIALSHALRDYAGVLSQTGNYPQAIYFELESLKLAEKSNDFWSIGWSYGWLVATYTDAEDYEHALFYARKEKSLVELHRNLSEGSMKRFWYDLYRDALYGFTIVYDKLNLPDSALTYLQMANRNEPDPRFNFFGNIYFKKGDYSRAISYYKRDYQTATDRNVYADAMSSCNGLAKAFRKINLTDSSIIYAKKVLELNNYAKYPVALLEALHLLAGVYKLQGNNDSTVKYLQLTLSTKDSLFNQRKIMQMQSMTFNEQLRQQDILEAQKAYQDRIKTYILIGGLIALLLIASVLFRSNRQKQKANKEIGKAYTELKSTQAQLIQSEKMASLGELTAGIAHEIQNPLNFVNNFSEVSNELISEMVDEVDKGNTTEVKAIAQNVQLNLEKIIHHGKRADAIVKGMLQHSRISTGQKELTDINALADEYLRLSYHGMRAKDKSFNATLQTDFDESIEKINIVPQDIGRVLLNLFNNAFYALTEKKKNANENYEPTVSVCTKKLDGKIEISVRDNGNGIPQKILDKIFQPFFTTKPTGQGTGLGLSLSYDIIKAHGGEIKVETKEGAEFIIILPISLL